MQRVLVLSIAAVILFIIVIGSASGVQPRLAGASVQEMEAPRVSDSISEAELQDLQTVADQEGISLQAAIDRYAWNDDFALVAASLREYFPEAFAGAEIVDAQNAWVAFKGQAPEAALGTIKHFSDGHSGVTVSVHTDVGFAEMEVERGIEAVHYAVLEQPEVRDATTSFDVANRQITTMVVLDETTPDDVLDDLRAVAAQALTEATRAEMLDSISISVVRSPHPVSGGTDSGK